MNADQFKKWKAMVDESILVFLPVMDVQAHTLLEAMSYSLKNGGKRTRPILTLATAEFCGIDEQIALPYACAIEYIHTYSLIHDDLPILDNDDLRRGVPTNHKVFGDSIALLAGDGLLSAAFEAISRDMMLFMDDPIALNRRVRAFHTIAKGAGIRGMVAGQTCDVESEGKRCSDELLSFIHTNKTGALIRSAVLAGGYLAGASGEKMNDLRQYSESIGLAFQIRDDVLDVKSTTEIMGKTVGKDELEKKATYVSLYGLEAAEKKIDELTDHALEALAKYYDHAEYLNAIANDLRTRTH